MGGAARALAYPVRLPVVLRYLSQLALMLAVLSLPPGAVAFAHGDLAVGSTYATLAAALVIAAWSGRQLPVPQGIQTNEALAVVGLTFVLTPLLMAIPLSLEGIGPEDAIFEAVSAFTTTGLTTVGAVEERSEAFIFGRAWLQWCGGLGIAALSVALLFGSRIPARRLTHPVDDFNLAATATVQARQILFVYVALTLAGTLILSIVLGDAFVALVHMLATLSTGGFSSFDGGLAALPLSAEWIITGFSLLGAIPLVLFYRAAAGQPRSLTDDPETRALGVLTFLSLTGVSLSLWWNAGLAPDEAIRHGVMLGTSAQTTTGFASLPIPELDNTSKLILICSMLVGGSTGSTAGGIKLLRVLIIFCLLRHYLRRSAMPPHAIAEVRLAGRVLEPPEVELSTLLLVMFPLTIGLSWIVFVAFGYDTLDALFEVGSAVGTVGLSAGITGAELEWPLKALLCVDMLLGRLEILALLVVLYPPTWFGRYTR